MRTRTLLGWWFGLALSCSTAVVSQASASPPSARVASRRLLDRPRQPRSFVRRALRSVAFALPGVDRPVEERGAEALAATGRAHAERGVRGPIHGNATAEEIRHTEQAKNDFLQAAQAWRARGNMRAALTNSRRAAHSAAVQATVIRAANFRRRMTAEADGEAIPEEEHREMQLRSSRADFEVAQRYIDVMADGFAMATAEGLNQARLAYVDMQRTLERAEEAIRGENSPAARALRVRIFEQAGLASFAAVDALEEQNVWWRTNHLEAAVHNLELAEGSELAAAALPEARSELARHRALPGSPPPRPAREGVW